MSDEKASCPRMFEAEAARDGRLDGPELQRFRAHLRHCGLCAQESRSLEQLGRALRALPPVTADDLHVRRERVRLLGALDAALVRRGSARRGLVPLLVAAALTTLALLRWQMPSEAPAPPPVATVARDAIAVEPNPEARWTRRVEAHRETITLSSGTLSISIDHSRAPRRLRLMLPDGELEDLGTTFSVTARDGATTHVAVQDGAVILRLRDRAPIVLNARDSWSAASPPAVAPAGAPPIERRAAAARPSALARAWPPPSASAAVLADPAREFRDALGALNAGDNARAAGLFAAFLARHPSAPNAEDAAYLRVIALQRAGSAAEMRHAARSYLARYPTAFRRTEIEPLAE